MSPVLMRPGEILMDTFMYWISGVSAFLLVVGLITSWRENRE